jgi:hypothetical protein
LKREIKAAIKLTDPGPQESSMIKEWLQMFHRILCCPYLIGVEKGAICASSEKACERASGNVPNFVKLPALQVL